MNTSDKKSPNTQTPYQEAVEHIGRAEQIVREKVGEKDSDYAEVEYVQMAAGVAYEGVLIAIDAYLERKEGLKYKKPQSIEEYRTRVTKQNKKLLPLLNEAYGTLYIILHLHGVPSSRVMIKGLNSAKEIIEYIKD
jgi:hypothetical protein